MFNLNINQIVKYSQIYVYICMFSSMRRDLNKNTFFSMCKDFATVFIASSVQAHFYSKIDPNALQPNRNIKIDKN